MRNFCILTGALLCAGGAFADWDYAADALANRTAFKGTASQAEVSAELARATTTGEAIGQHGEPMKDVAPFAYPGAAVAQGASRADVVAELERAMRDGDMLTMDQSGLTYNQRAPTQLARSAQPTELQALKATD